MGKKKFLLFFRKGEEVPAVLPEVSEKLLRKCGGVLLAIITMASLLAKKHADDWSKVYEKIGFGSDVEGNKDVVNTRKILMFSYYDLPDHLRACLLHLHIFPEDYVIKKETLIWKWAAEGFIVEHEETGLFELGERYFNELVNRNVIMPVEDDSHGGIIIGCRVHDLFLDIIYSESTAENFVVVLNGTTANKQKLHSGRKARRLGVHKRAAEQVNFLVNICQESVRSFSATMCHFKSEVSLSRFKVLRVLAIEECTFAKSSSYNLKSIGCLVRLRYLGLYNTPIDELPKEIGNLTDLQTLDLRGTNIKELPGRVALLRQLKCLRADDTTAVPDWIGELTSLEELRLDDVSNSVNFVKELGKLTELRELQIWIEDFDEKSNKALVESMGNLRKIQVLGLESSMQGEEANWEGYVPPSQLRDLRLTIASSGLPAWINVSRVPFLLHLCVDVKAVEEQDLDILGALPELISLELIMPPDVFPTIKGAFPKLRCFDTSAPFRFLEEAMPRLESLRFKVTVPALKRAGFDFEFATLSNLPCLQTVEVEISCRGARANNSQVAEAAVKRAVQAHPEGPILTIKKTDK